MKGAFIKQQISSMYIRGLYVIRGASTFMQHSPTLNSPIEQSTRFKDYLKQQVTMQIYN